MKQKFCFTYVDNINTYRKIVTEIMTIGPHISRFLLQDTQNWTFYLYSQECLEELTKEISVLSVIIFANTLPSERKKNFLACVFQIEKEYLQNQK